MHMNTSQASVLKIVHAAARPGSSRAPSLSESCQPGVPKISQLMLATQLQLESQPELYAEHRPAGGLGTPGNFQAPGADACLLLSKSADASRCCMGLSAGQGQHAGKQHL